MNTVRRILSVAAFGALLAASSPAFAQHHPNNPPRGNGGQGGGNGNGNGNGHNPGRHSIPEFDPATAGAIAAIVASGTVLLVRRRKG